MTTTTDTEISQLVFNKLSKAQYDDLKAKGQINENEFYITPDLNNGGGGFEVGDIGIAILPINESENKRRYLNGQTIVQSQFPTFSTKVKTAVLQYPSLGTTESNWQAEVTNSKLGQCGKFVVDNNAGTIRLPKIININGLQDLTNLGRIKVESLPNITGQISYDNTLVKDPSGVFQEVSRFDSRVVSGETHYGFDTSFDASRSSATYQNNAPVQQEAVQYPYFIQVASGVEETIDTSKEIELNNPFSLFDTKWSDHLLDNLSWIRSDTFEWQSGIIYQSAYQKLIEEYNDTASIAKEDHYIENFRRVGTVKVNEYIASNFSIDNYLVLNTNFFGGNADWEFNTEFTTNLNSTHQHILSTTVPYGHTELYIGTDSKLYFDSYFNNTSTKRAGISSTKILSNNTKYTVKIGYNLAAKKYYISFLDTDTNTYIEDASISNADVISSPAGKFILGIEYGTSTPFPFLGTINLGKTYFSRAELTDGNLYQYNISYKLSPNNYKITDVSNEALLTTIFNEVGVAYYYLLDTTNSQFKLPRTKWGFVGTRNSGGNFVEESLPNITGNFEPMSRSEDSSAVGAFYKKSSGNSQKDASQLGTLFGFDASLVSSTYQDSAPVQQRSTEMYLYFYVGEAVQGANLINMESTLLDVAFLKKDTLKTNQITNCITEISQDIKLEYNTDHTITLKSGSKLWVPNGKDTNGNNLFKQRTITADVNYTYIYAVQCFLLHHPEQENFSLYTAQCYSGDTAPTIPSSAGPGVIWYDTNTNYIKWSNDRGATWIYTEDISFPIALATGGDQTTITNFASLDQTFNGFGFIGSTVFALPGVKGLIPDGRNEDGSLNNIEFILDEVKLSNSLNRANDTDALFLYNDLTLGKTKYRDYIVSRLPQDINPEYRVFWYNPEINLIKEYKEGPTGKTAMLLGTYSIDSNDKIISFTSKLFFNAIDYNDSSFIAQQAFPSNKYIDLSLGASDTSYTAPANGYFVCRKHAAAIGQFVAMENLDNKMMSWDVAQYSNNEMRVWLPVVKGQKVIIEYNASGTLDYFRFIYAEGEV